MFLPMLPVNSRGWRCSSSTALRSQGGSNVSTSAMAHEAASQASYLKNALTCVVGGHTATSGRFRARRYENERDAAAASLAHESRKQTCEDAAA
jgi:hypothetical protein